MTKIYWAGDSTVQNNDITTYPQTGIGQVLSLYLRPGVMVENHARNGKSTKTFLDEGRLKPIEEAMEEGDFFFIQFGHNDEKKDKPHQYTDPFGSFQDNLEIFVNAARDKKAWPVLITPLERRWFGSDGRLEKGWHVDYVAGMKRLAGRLDVPLIDLNAMSREAMESAGMEKSKSWYMNLPVDTWENYPQGLEDNSHLQYGGAVIYAGCIARGLKQLGGIYADLLLEKG